MGLERLAPLGDEGGKPPLPRRTVAPASATEDTQDPLPTPRTDRKAARHKGGDRPKKSWPTREEREARAESKAQARAEEIAADPTGYARQACLMLLEFAPRTRKELADALAKKGVPADAADEVLGRFTEVGIIDDALFASMWVTSRHRGRGLAGRALSQELRRKGIDDELVRDAVAELDPETEVETARTLVRRKLPSTRGLATEARIRRLAGMLARKGYGAGLAFRVVKDELEREGTEAPELSFEALQALDDG